MTLRIKNFDRFQHFKDRRPPWIKLYRDLLDDHEWHKLDAVSAKMLVSLWLIASEDESKTGLLPPVETIAFRLRIPEKIALQCVSKLGHWLVQDDIKMISSRYQDDTPETEIERETERETETEARTAPDIKKPKSKTALPPIPQSLQTTAFATEWENWIQHRREIRHPLTPSTAKSQLAECEAWGEARAVAAIQHSIRRGWQGLFEDKNAQQQTQPKQPTLYNGERITEDQRTPLDQIEF